MSGMLFPFTRHTTRWVACLLYTVVIVVLSLMSSSSLSHFAINIPCEDKIGHFGVYGLYAALLLWSVRGEKEVFIAAMRRQEVLIVAYCSAFGILMEILQETLCYGDRHFEVGDILADIGGALTFTVLIRLLTRQRKSAGQQIPADADR